ncbi:hypothetical protein MASR2M50_25160 [Thauera sp.]
MHVGDEQLHRIGQLVEVGDAILVQRHHRLQAHPGLGIHLAARQAAGDLGGQERIVGLPDVLRVEPVQLLGVELRGRRRDVVEVEPLDELLDD